jgi:hypothetical protein
VPEDTPPVTTTNYFKNLPTAIIIIPMATEIDFLFNDPGAGFHVAAHNCDNRTYTEIVTATVVEIPFGGLATLDFEFELRLDP